MEDDRSPDVIAEWIERKAKKDPKLGQILDNARLFGELRSQPAWVRLRDVMQAHKRVIRQRIADRVWDDPRKMPTADEIAYYKGFFEGANWIVSHPEHAEAALDRVARAAWLLSNDEDIDKED